MVYNICEILKTCIEDESLSYVETIAGLVQVETVQKKASKTDLIQKKFPIYCPIKQECDPNKIDPLIPDCNRKSLFYFENNGNTILNDRDKRFFNYTSSIRLVGWLNPRKMGSNDCDISCLISAEIMNILEKSTFNSGEILKIKIRPSALLVKDSKIFSKYLYGKKFYNLIEYPYDYFAIDLFVDFSINKDCISKFTPTDELC